MHISPPSSFGHLLKEFRRRKKFTQQQLATLVEVHRNSVSLWERELERPETMGVLLRLTSVLDLDEEEKRALIEARFGTLSLISLYNMPYNRNPYFTGREHLLSQLHQQLTSGNSATTTQALIGLGGIGKTQIALEYAYRYQESYHDIFWINADTPETILSTFVDMARQLWLTEKNESNERHIVDAIKRWLHSHKNWLLIFDNVEDISALKTFLPAAAQGSVLITSRLRILSNFSHTCEILPMPYEESISFLLHRTGFVGSDTSLDALPSDLLKSACALVKAMAGLPLALDQAGAYIERTGCSLIDYQHLYQNHQISLLNIQTIAHPSSVVKTFLASFEKIAQVNSAAADLLYLCAFLAPDAIPEELFTQGASHLGSVLGKAADDLFLFNLALGDAFHYSLVQRQIQNHTFSLHRLVQIVLKAMMDEATRTQWLLRALNLITAHISQIQEESIWSNHHRYLPHIKHFTLEISSRELDRTEQASLATIWYYIGLVAEHSSHLADAKNAYQQGRLIYRHLGDIAKAQTYLDQSLQLAQLSQHRWLIAETQGEYGWLFLQQEQYSEAQDAFQMMQTEAQIIQAPLLIAHALFGLAHVAARQHHHEQARSLAQKSLNLFIQLEDAQRHHILQWLEDLPLIIPGVDLN